MLTFTCTTPSSECAHSKACAAALHHFEECQERIQEGKPKVSLISLTLPVAPAYRELIWFMFNSSVRTKTVWKSSVSD